MLTDNQITHLLSRINVGPGVDKVLATEELRGIAAMYRQWRQQPQEDRKTGTAQLEKVAKLSANAAGAINRLSGNAHARLWPALSGTTASEDHPGGPFGQLHDAAAFLRALAVAAERGSQIGTRGPLADNNLHLAVQLLADWYERYTGEKAIAGIDQDGPNATKPRAGASAFVTEFVEQFGGGKRSVNQAVHALHLLQKRRPRARDDSISGGVAAKKE